MIAAAGVIALTAACGTSTAGSPTTGPAAPTVTSTVTATQTETATATETAMVTPAPPPPSTSSPTSPPPAATRTETPATTQEAPPPLADPDAEIRAAVASAFGVADRYWSDVFTHWEGNHGEPVYWDTPRLFHGDGFYDSSRGFFGTCGSERRPPDNAGFCKDGYAGTGELAWDIVFMHHVAADGDGALYAVVAHEVAHAAQWRFWFDGEGGATPEPPTIHHDSPKYEQQADCIAGVTLARAVQDGYLPVELDLDGIARSLVDAGDDGSSHGTPAERTGAFGTGYRTGDVESCLYNQGRPPTT